MKVAKPNGNIEVTKLAGVFLFYLMLALTMTYPLVAHFAQGVLGPPADNFEYLYKLWWFKSALFDRGISPFFNPNVFYPEGYFLALHEMTLTNILLGLPLTILCGEVVSYNTLILLTFVLSGFGTYLLTLHLTHRRLPALLSGVAFAFCSYRIAHLGYGHLNLLSTQWLPLLFLSLEQLLKTKKVSSAVLVGIFFALLALSSWYYAPMATIFTIAYVLQRERPWRQQLLTGHHALLFTVSVITAGLLMAPSLLLTLQHRGDMVFPLREVDLFSASAEDFIMPNVMHPLWGKLVASHYATRVDVMEQIIGLSWIAMALSAAALRPQRRRVSSVFTSLYVLSVVLAMGTSLHIGGQRVYIGVPAWVEKAFTAIIALIAKRFALHPQPSYYELRVPAAIYVPLPTLLLYLYMPLFDAMRVWARFGLVSAFAVSILAGIGLARIMSTINSSRRRILLAALCLAATIFELMPAPHPLGWSEVRAQPADKWLAQQTGEIAIVELPLWRSERGPRLYATAVHGKPIAYGYGTFFPRNYRRLRPILWWDFPNAQAIQLLHEWRVQYVLLRAESYSEEWAAVQNRISKFAELRLVAAFPEQPVYHGDWLARSLSDLAYAFLIDHVYIYELR